MRIDAFNKRLGRLLVASTVVVLGVPACFDFGGYSEGEKPNNGSGGVGQPGTGGQGAGGTGGSGGTETCASTCMGCCNGEACVSTGSQTASTCGVDGAACAPCSPGEACVSGTCKPDPGLCSSQTCPNGCCVGSICYEPADQDWYACGTGGETCAMCDYAVRCSGGTCDPSHWSPTAQFSLRMGVVTVSCGSCDTWSGPDPYVCMTVRGTTVCSHYCKDYSTCDYGADSTFPWTHFKASDFTSGDSIFAVWDSDWPDSDNKICSGPMKFPQPFAKSAKYYIDPSWCSPGEGSLVSAWFTLDPE